MVACNRSFSEKNEHVERKAFTKKKKRKKDKEKGEKRGRRERGSIFIL